jgi:hypothetical protein
VDILSPNGARTTPIGTRIGTPVKPRDDGLTALATARSRVQPSRSPGTDCRGEVGWGGPPSAGRRHARHRASHRRPVRRFVAHSEALHAKANSLWSLQSGSKAELDALLPSVLNRAFAGKL